MSTNRIAVRSFIRWGRTYRVGRRVHASGKMIYSVGKRIDTVGNTHGRGSYWVGKGFIRWGIHGYIGSHHAHIDSYSYANK